MVENFPEEDIIEIEDFITISGDALNQIHEGFKAGNSFNPADTNIPYKKREYQQLGASLNGTFKKINWQLYIIFVNEITQKKVKSLYWDTKSTKMKADIISPKDSKIKQIFRADLYNRRIPKGNNLALFIIDDNSKPDGLVLTMPLKDTNLDLKDIENKIKLKVK